MAGRQNPQVIVRTHAPSQALPALVSFFFPPFGQLIQGRIVTWLFWMAAMALAWISLFVGLFFSPVAGEAHGPPVWFCVLAIAMLPLFWFLCVVDAAIYKPRN